MLRAKRTTISRTNTLTGPPQTSMLARGPMRGFLSFCLHNTTQTNASLCNPLFAYESDTEMREQSEVLIASLLFVVFLVLPPMGQVHSNCRHDQNQQHQNHNFQ